MKCSIMLHFIWVFNHCESKYLFRGFQCSKSKGIISFINELFSLKQITKETFDNIHTCIAHNGWYNSNICSLSMVSAEKYFIWFNFIIIFHHLHNYNMYTCIVITAVLNRVNKKVKSFREIF